MQGISLFNKLNEDEAVNAHLPTTHLEAILLIQGHVKFYVVPQ